MVRKNLTYLHLYNGFLASTSDEAEIQAYIEAAQQDTGFVGFYFLSYDGNYMTVTGETGYLGLQANLDEKLSKGEDIVMNAALPGAEIAGQLCFSRQCQQLCDLPGWASGDRQFRKPQGNGL